MDISDRWENKNNNSRNLGHKLCLVSVDTIIKQSIKKNIQYLTLFAFST